MSEGIENKDSGKSGVNRSITISIRYDIVILLLATIILTSIVTQHFTGIDCPECMECDDNRTLVKNIPTPADSKPGIDKRAMVGQVYQTLDEYFDINTKNPYPTSNIDTGDFDYDLVFVTLMHDNAIRGCMRGERFDDIEDTYTDLAYATNRTIEDDRFGGVFKEKECADAEVILNFFKNRRKLESNEMPYLEKNIDLGIHAIEIIHEGSRAYYKESVPISKKWNLKKTLEELCDKRKADKDCYKDEKNTEIYIYDTITFKGDRDGNIVDLYRYNILVNTSQISEKTLGDSLDMAHSWFQKHINSKTGMLEYKHYPSTGHYSSDNNDVRNLGALWAMSELGAYLEDDSLEPVLTSTLDNYLKYRAEEDGNSYIWVDGSGKLAYNAFIVLTLVNYDEYSEGESIAKDFAQGILYMQQDDGSYKTYFNSTKNTGQDFYPGESMVALMRLYEHTGDEKYLESVEKAFPHYRAYWRKNKNTAFVSWHSQAYRMLYEQNHDKELAEFTFEINDWLIDNYQVMESEYPDMIGCFYKEDYTIGTATYLEGVNDAYYLALEVGDKEHAEKYEESIRLGTRCLLQHQFNEENTFYLENPEKTVGGFKQSLVTNSQRNDYTQHGVMATMKTLENSIFN